MLKFQSANKDSFLWKKLYNITKAYEQQSPVCIFARLLMQVVQNQTIWG